MTAHEPTASEQTPSSSGPARGSASVRFERERGVTRVATRRGLAHVTVHLPAEEEASARLALLQALAGAGVPVFLVKLAPDALSFAVRADVVARCEELLAKQGGGARFTLLRDLGLVTVLAGAMRDLSGVMARIYEALVQAGVAVRQTGDAYNAVILLVAGNEVDRAARALRQTFALAEEAEETDDAQEEAGVPPRDGVPPR
jgi:aspartate kinase